MTVDLKTTKLTPVVGEIEGTQDKVYNWHGNYFIVGPGFSTRITDEIEHNRNAVKQNVIIIVGTPGAGKSYYGIRLAQILDKNFNPLLQIVFERGHLLKLIGPDTPLKMGQVILVDEAQFIAGARNWFQDIQKDIMDHMEAVRSQGFVILIVALHLTILDKTLRQHIFSHMIDMRDRGVAVIYRMKMNTFEEKVRYKRLGGMELLLPDIEYCEAPNCLRCKALNYCMTIRAVYERMKRKFLAKKNTESSVKIAAQERRKLTDYDGMIDKIIAYKENLVFRKNGSVNTESVRLILEKKYGESIPTTIANNIIKRGEIQYPDVFKHEKGVKQDENI